MSEPHEQMGTDKEIMSSLLRRAGILNSCSVPATWKIAEEFRRRYTANLLAPSRIAQSIANQWATQQSSAILASWARLSASWQIPRVLTEQNKAITRSLGLAMKSQPDLLARAIGLGELAARLNAVTPLGVSRLIQDSPIVSLLRAQELIRDQFARSVRLRAAYDALFARGWLPPTAWQGIVAFVGIQQLDPDKVEEHLINWLEIYLPDVVDLALEHIPESGWKPLVRQSVTAHKRGDYDIAVTGWVAAVQGIAKEIVDPRFEIFQYKESLEYTRKRVARLSVSAAKSDSFLRLVIDISRPTSKPASHIPPRAAVAHGVTPSFGTKGTSLKFACFLLAVVNHFACDAVAA